MLARGTVATSCLRAQWLPLCRLRVGDTLRAFANAVTAVSLSSLLTRSALGLVFRLGGRADQEARWPASLADSALRLLRDSYPGPGLAAAGAVPDCQWQLELGTLAGR